MTSETPQKPHDTVAPAIPFVVIIATIVSGIALWLREGKTSLVLPFLGAALIVSCMVKYRLRSVAIRNILRIVIAAAIMILYKVHPAAEQNTFIDSVVMDQLAEIALAEVAIMAWTRYTITDTGASWRTLPVFLSGFAFVVATNTYDDAIGKYFTPVYVALLALGLQSYRSAHWRNTRLHLRWTAVSASFAAFLIGFGLFHLLNLNRDGLTDWANRMLNVARYPMSTTGLSEESHLSSLFGQEGTLDRVMRIRTRADVTYLRGTSMYIYRGAAWGPSGRNTERKYINLDGSELQGSTSGEPAEVTRYARTRGIIFAPLNATSIDLQGTINLRWARDDGGSLRADEPMPDNYSMLIGADTEQGVMSVAPSSEYRKQLLDVAIEIDPRVRALARNITSGRSDPLTRARAIEAYLPQHHGYSLNIKVNKKDPLTDFLLSDKPAHCEFFATAAVNLMRCVGIPARYVVGYYAHEVENGSIVVRQRDAHAWAECWIDGKGWVTIDATPGDGRPSSDHSAIPAWKRAQEKLQDVLAGIKNRLTSTNLGRATGLLICLVLATYALQSRFHFHFLTDLFRWRRSGKEARQRYSVKSEDFVNLLASFETTAKRYNLVCPPEMPWEEFLNYKLKQDTSKSAQSGLQAALSFIAVYNNARFGPETVTSDAADMRKLIALFDYEMRRVSIDAKESHT